MSCEIFKLCDISDAGGEGVEKAGIKGFFLQLSSGHCPQMQSKKQQHLGKFHIQTE